MSAGCVVKVSRKFRRTQHVDKACESLFVESAKQFHTSESITNGHYNMILPPAIGTLVGKALL